jgi:hypothetical protein
LAGAAVSGAVLLAKGDEIDSGLAESDGVQDEGGALPSTKAAFRPMSLLKRRSGTGKRERGLAKAGMPAGAGSGWRWWMGGGPQMPIRGSRLAPEARNGCR